MTEPDLDLAQRLFDGLRDAGFDGVGITRDTYGDGEQRAHALVAQAAHALGLQVRRDAALNLYVTLPGRDRAAPAVLTGSHLDSVPRGGNYDGAAGVVAGMAVLAGWVRAGRVPARDVTVIGIRAEESAWFPVSYIGSKAAFGILPAAALEVRRFDTGRTLADHLSALGGRPGDVATGRAALAPASIACFVELHIEQGPVLLAEGTPLAVVSGICGSLRYREAKVTGRYAHSGATPRGHRQDAVVALSELVVQLQSAWARMEDQGHELTLTFGQVSTDPAQADFSKVAGLVRFCIDIRSRSPQTLQRMDAELRLAVQAVEAARGVRFDLGPSSGSQPGVMDTPLQAELDAGVRALGLQAHAMPSGAGHDAAVFATQGVPTAMLFVRNAHGSHNPDEAMDLADFAAGTRVLAGVLAQRAGLDASPR